MLIVNCHLSMRVSGWRGMLLLSMQMLWKIEWLIGILKYRLRLMPELYGTKSLKKILIASLKKDSSFLILIWMTMTMSVLAAQVRKSAWNVGNYSSQQLKSFRKLWSKISDLNRSCMFSQEEEVCIFGCVTKKQGCWKIQLEKD